MEQLFLVLAKIMPEEKLLDDLSEALQNYKILNNEETKSKLLINVMFISIRLGTEKKDLMETINDFNQKKKTLELFEDKKQ